MGNTFKTALLLTLVGALFLIVGYAAGGESGLTVAFVLALVFNFGSYWFSDKLVLAMHDARLVQAGDPRALNETVADLCLKDNLPAPKVYVVPTNVPNAFATGRNAGHSAVAVTAGILRVLNPRELRAVLGHEVSHIRHRDILIGTIVAAFATAIMFIARLLQWTAFFGYGGRDERGRGMNPLALLATIILAPIAAALIQAAISRTREFMADESGAKVSGDPVGLASALQKISDPRLLSRLGAADELQVEKPAMSHLYIVSHLSGEGFANLFANLFATHPPTQERIKRLMAMAKGE